MKACKIKYRLSAYLDKELNPRLAESIARHLQQCVDCQQEAKQLLRVYDFLRQDDSTIRDTYLLTRVRAHLRPQVKSSWRGQLGRIFAPATVAFGLVLGFVLGSGLSKSILDRNASQVEIGTDSGIWSETSSLASRYVEAFSDGTTETGEDYD